MKNGAACYPQAVDNDSAVRVAGRRHRKPSASGEGTLGAVGFFMRRRIDGRVGLLFLAAAAQGCVVHADLGFSHGPRGGARVASAAAVAPERPAHLAHGDKRVKGKALRDAGMIVSLVGVGVVSLGATAMVGTVAALDGNMGCPLALSSSGCNVALGGFAAGVGAVIFGAPFLLVGIPLAAHGHSMMNAPPPAQAAASNGKDPP